MSERRPLPSFVSIGSYMLLADRTRADSEIRAARWSGAYSEWLLLFRLSTEKVIARFPVEQGGLGVKDHE